MIKRYFVGKAGISAVNLTIVMDVFHQLAARSPLGYVCLTDAAGICRAEQDDAFGGLLNASFLTLTDSSSLAWIGRRRGYRHCGAVTGAGLMHSIFLTSAMQGYTHFFCGPDGRQLRQLKDYVKNSYMGIRLAGAEIIDPEKPEEEADRLSEQLNTLKPPFFWCGLPSPQQEQFVAALQPKLTHTSCIAVGDAFETLAAAGLVLPDPGKRTLPGKSRFQAIRMTRRFRSSSLPVLLWLLRELASAQFLGKKSRRRRRGSA
ncbi:MAG: WecB/TagA/CpsF family glycosyltransferase [Candidatus Cyclonatronum sp.]|uniref:WecB/TagA/CpsF family glycosyltransferase n=1 Tax=Cyclonatronum sp. TaxID=3024185 RepID=UPI0025BA7368|nr:WecB/TagA/CpsF family glycosyltransferase [Cyclonatronum sp.]MCH8487748.1 WecB/TagA/CpsF family glycosyltransferase [Cyclonatronum sp.]